MPGDMALSELHHYKGSSPKPDDFDAYWERAMGELERQPLEYELVPADFKTPLVECFHLYFTGVGGARVHCKLARPKRPTAGPGPGLAIFHGYACDSGDWLEKVTYAMQGFTVMAMDCRGQGGGSQDNLTVQGTTIRGHILRGLDDPDPDRMYYRHVFLDTVQTVRILMAMEQVDPQRIGVYGYSQGGALATACAALEPRVSRVVPVYPFLSDYKRAWEMNVSQTAYEELVYFFRFFDPHHLREEEIFNKLGYIDIQNLAERIRARMLWVTGLTDVICPPSTQFAAYNKIRSHKELLVYHEFGHEALPYLSDRMFQFFLEFYGEG